MSIYTAHDITQLIEENFKPTRLYIKEVGGKKYFGKTSKEDILSYVGSGKIWKDRVKKYGRKNVKTLWVSVWFYCPYHIQQFALMFSEINQIVESDEWDNYIPEDGLSGGWGTKWLNTPKANKRKGDSQRGVKCPARGPEKGTPSHFKGKNRPESTKKKMSKPKSLEHAANISKAVSEVHKKNGKRYDAINQSTNEQLSDILLSEFSKEYNLSYVTVWEYAKKNKDYKGWRFTLVCR